jgi:hypothetical protein
MQSHDEYPLSPYDEYPVHQAPYPVSYIPATDYAWDEGYFYGAYSAEQQLFIIVGFRINPNANVIGAYCNVNHKGVMRSLRLSRTWREQLYTALGPLRFDVVEPFRDIRISLAANEANMEMDLHWLGLSPPLLSQHHLATVHGRRTTDQSRYNQTGTARGWLKLDGKRFDIEPETWGACRDHSWGIYEARPPLVPEAKWLPPPGDRGPARALRFSMFFHAGDHTGHFHLHEDSDGRQIATNDAFGIPFEGAVDRGWASRLQFKTCRHELQFYPDTRCASSGRLYLTDVNGGNWQFDFETAAPPAPVLQSGYHMGSWKDGGTIATYHGPGTYSEWDEFDFSKQPTPHTLYGQTVQRKVYGAEHVVRVKVIDPQGKVSHGLSEVEIFLNGRYSPYGFEAQVAQGGLTGRGIV